MNTTSKPSEPTSTSRAPLPVTFKQSVDEDLIFAYVNGELSGEERERVEEAISLDPAAAELARDFAMFPERAVPGEPAYLSQEELAADWKKVQARVSGGKTARVLPFRLRWKPALGLAAAASLVLAAFSWAFFERSGRHEAEQQLALALAPQVNVETNHLVNLLPRGAAESGQRVFDLQPGREVFLLKLSPRERPTLTDFRLEVRRQGSAEAAPIWQAEGLKLYADGTFSLALPRRAFEPGRYELRVVGRGSAGEQTVDTFLVGIPAR